MGMSDPKPPTPPVLLTVDPVASEEAVTILRQAADAAGYERTRHERALAAALTLWIGKEGQRVEREGRELAQGWADLEVDLRRQATEIRLAVVASQQENRRRQAAYSDAMGAWQDLVAPPGT